MTPPLGGWLRKARRIAVLTGAGISAESGIPTFRDKQTGLWEKFDAAELATPAAFRRDPALVWGWYEWRRMQVLRAEPNAAHRGLTTIAERVPRFTLITQNVDDLHERAGSQNVIHLHGELARPIARPADNPMFTLRASRTSRSAEFTLSRPAANPAARGCVQASCGSGKIYRSSSGWQPSRP